MRQIAERRDQDKGNTEPTLEKDQVARKVKEFDLVTEVEKGNQS